MTGPFLVTVFAQLAGATAFWVGLRPDPLLTARAIDPNRSGAKPKGSIKTAFEILRTNSTARYAVATIALSHMVMVAVMSMTPVHMKDMGFSLDHRWLHDQLARSWHVGVQPDFRLAFRQNRQGHSYRSSSNGLCTFAGLLRVRQPRSLQSLLGLLLLGLGWSAATVAGSSLLSSRHHRGDEKTHVQGLSDSLMSLSGATGGAVAGLVLASVTYPGLSAVAMVPVSAILLMTGLRRFRKMSFTSRQIVTTTQAQ
jgi:hypothetical protein